MQDTHSIPLVNLSRQYARIRDEIGAAITGVLESNAFILGPFTEAFEAQFAALHGVEHAIGCSSGTSAISLALEALSIGPGDEVITVAHTFAATAGAILHAGATPVFVDIEPGAYTMDPAAVAAAITPRTRALIPVHIYGTPCDLTALRAIADEHDLALVEDAAQAHGAAYHGRPVGSFGSAATFSFYPGKNLGAYGDAGAITTGDASLAERLRRLRDHGRTAKYSHDIVGYNHRIDGLQSAILSVKLRHLPAWNDRRRALADRYEQAFRPRGFKTVNVPPGVTPVYHLYVVEVSNRDAVQGALKQAGIATGVHYPLPLHLQPAFTRWAGHRALPHTERAASRVLSLPICGDLSDAEQERVIEAFLRVATP